MSKPVVHDSSDPAQIKAAREYEREVKRDFASIVKSKEGRRWLHELLFITCHLDRPSMVPGDPHSTEFNEGARSVGLKVLNDLKREHVAAYLLMLKENQDVD